MCIKWIIREGERLWRWGDSGPPGNERNVSEVWEQGSKDLRCSWHVIVRQCCLRFHSNQKEPGSRSGERPWHGYIPPFTLPSHVTSLHDHAGSCRLRIRGEFHSDLILFNLLALDNQESFVPAGGVGAGGGWVGVWCDLDGSEVARRRESGIFTDVIVCVIGMWTE